MDNQDHDIALRSWLSAGAPGIQTLPELCEETGKRVASANKHVEQFAIYITSIHPEIPGTYCYWTADEGVRVISFTAEQLNSDLWLGCPAQHCGERGRLINHVFDNMPEYGGRSETKFLARHGYRQFVYAPLLSEYTLFNNTAGFGTKKVSPTGKYGRSACCKVAWPEWSRPSCYTAARSKYYQLMSAAMPALEF